MHRSAPWWPLVAALVPIDILGEMVSIGTLFAFILVCGAVIYLRRTDAALKRPFRVPGVPMVPVLGMLFCSAADGRPAARTRGCGWSSGWRSALVIYFAYGRKHSVLRRTPA